MDEDKDAPLEIGYAAAINIFTTLIFLIAFSILRLQPLNERIYFPKRYLKGSRTDPPTTGNKIVNLNYRSYIKFLNWVPDALKESEPYLIKHAGLDSAVFLRIYLLGLKLFVPIFFFTWAILVPVNWTNNTLERSNATYSEIDKLSISNIPEESHRFYAHVIMAYAVTFWTCFTLKKEYETVTNMRINFLQSEKRRPDHFTVLVKNVPPDSDKSVSKAVEQPPDSDKSVSKAVEHFFSANHHDNYLTHQVVYNANKLAKLVKKKKKMQNSLDYYKTKHSRNSSQPPMMKTGSGKKVDAIEYHETEIEKLKNQIAEERKDVMNNPKAMMPVAFVSFKTNWGAAVCAQTQQARNPTQWVTEWAPEPRDVYWKNLAIPDVSLTVRKLIIGIAFFFLTIFYMIPIAFVQSLANIKGIEKKASFLKPINEMTTIKSLIQGFLPGIVLKIFLILLPRILMTMSKFEGYLCKSRLERRSASRYYLFNFVNVFLGSIIVGSTFEQLHIFIHDPARIPKIIGLTIPMKATFFMTYIMVDGWSGPAEEILRLKKLIIFHLKNFLLVKTDRDRKHAMDPGSIRFNRAEPQIQLYFLIGLVYAVVTPLLTPFILVFFGLAYVVYRHQIINVYHQKYESQAAFWPDVHGRVITALMISQLLLMGLLSTKLAVSSTPFLLALPVLTIGFHIYCKGRFEPAFIRYPLQEAMMKDTIEREKEPNLNLKGYLQKAYIHPVFKEEDDSDAEDSDIEAGDQKL